MSTLLLGLSPMAAYSSMRFFTLFLVTLSEYMHVPINAFAPFESLQLMLFVTPSASTKELLSFSAEYYVDVLWRLAVMYVVFAVWLEIVVRFLLKIAKGNEWALMTKLVSIIGDNKQITYQNMYITYELAIYCLLAKIFKNADKISPVLTFLVILHLLFILASKLHFIFTF
jgi:hypothetical protein